MVLAAKRMENAAYKRTAEKPFPDEVDAFDIERPVAAGPALLDTI